MNLSALKKIDAVSTNDVELLLNRTARGKLKTAQRDKGDVCC